MRLITKNEEEKLMSKNILAIDDDKAICRLLDFRLKLDGFSVQQANSGYAALQMLECGPLPDAILLDICMPEMTGLEFCRKIKSDERFKHLKVIIITALRDDKNKAEAMEAGADAIIFKPFRGADVIKKIEELTSGDLKEIVPNVETVQAVTAV
jgi:CheY-like chemotaxis protein